MKSKTDRGWIIVICLVIAIICLCGIMGAWEMEDEIKLAGYECEQTGGELVQAEYNTYRCERQ